MDIHLSVLERRVGTFVIKAYIAEDLPQYPYHNLVHTQSVVTRVREIAGYYGLGSTDHFVLVAAAWFHDIGHLCGEPEGYEDRSVRIMEQQLADIPEGIRSGIAGCIIASRSPGYPLTTNEKILCDANTYHYGTPLFTDVDGLMRREMEMRGGMTIPDWHRRRVELLQRHRFFTEYCQQLLEPGKQRNIAWLE